MRNFFVITARRGPYRLKWDTQAKNSGAISFPKKRHLFNILISTLPERPLQIAGTSECEFIQQLRAKTVAITTHCSAH